VPYIIESKERAEFLALYAEAERDSFVREFWDARNPTPGAETNSYKEGSGQTQGKRIGRPKAPASQFKLPLELRGS
jgi:hypothetical protein